MIIRIPDSFKGSKRHAQTLQFFSGMKGPKICSAHKEKKYIGLNVTK